VGFLEGAPVGSKIGFVVVFSDGVAVEGSNKLYKLDFLEGVVVGNLFVDPVVEVHVGTALSLFDGVAVDALVGLTGAEIGNNEF